MAGPGKKSMNELQNELLDLRREQLRLRMQHAAGQLSQPHLLRQKRRELARIKTAINKGDDE